MNYCPRILVVLAMALGLQNGRAAGKVSFESGIKPLLSQYCYGCHGEKKKGGLDLRIYNDLASAKKDPQVFEKVMDHLQNHEMPPENKPQPSPDERDLIMNWIEAEILGCDCAHPDPGRVTIRRLNRAEYNNTVRDLVGVNFHPADDFPADDVGYGFDNIGDVLSLSPILLEKYLNAAQKILDAAIVTAPSSGGPSARFNAADMDSTEKGAPYGDHGRMLSTEGEVFTKFQFPKDGEYLLRARAFGQQAGPEPARMEFRVDGKAIKVADVTAVENKPEVYETRFSAQAGEKRVAAAFINDFYNPSDPNPENRDRNLIIEYVEVVGPIEPLPPPRSHLRIFTRQPTPQTTNQVAREILANFARRAYRRPVKPPEVDRLMELFGMAQTDGENFETSVKLALQAVLVSPNFLFRGELQLQPDNPKAIHAVDDYALASRLSYFLWSSMPDEELFALAEKGKLRKNLDAQVSRMLKDPKARALVENFADQWLQIRNLSAVSPNHKLFPGFSDDLRAAMAKETELYFQYVMQQNHNVLEFIDSDYTFLNEPLARLYGIEGVTGGEFQRVTLKDHQRGGLLTQASILTITSNPTRTSPVKRGKWVLENILGAPPPPPPPNVPALKEGKEIALTGTLRQRMERHREDPICASCHARMDPIGFGFENFNGIGAWRTNDGNFPIDPAGELTSGESFQGAGDLKAILLKQKKEQFVRCLSEKLLTYALGRGLEHYDKCAVDQIAKDLSKNDYKFNTLIAGVVKSAPFQMRRGEQVSLQAALEK